MLPFLFEATPALDANYIFPPAHVLNPLTHSSLSVFTSNN